MNTASATGCPAPPLRVGQAVSAFFALALTACSASAETAVPVEIVETASGYQLLRGGVPYAVRGVGAQKDLIASAAAHGANSIRTWATDTPQMSAAELLDRAHALGMTVALGLPVAPERSGFDYDDEQAVREQFERMRAEVLKHRGHPALLFWIIGNELNLHAANPKVYDAVGDLARMIGELDPDHPRTTALAGFTPEVVAEVQARAPDLDFLSFQVYGSLFDLPERLETAGFDAPFMVTEWGTIGHWEVEAAPWGAPVEPTSSEKAAVYLQGYQEVLAPLENQMIGSYVFFWGQKQERTPTWYGVFTEDGDETEVVDVMHGIWKGATPANRAPELVSMHLDGGAAKDGVSLVEGRLYAAAVAASDPDEDALRYAWMLKPESEATQAGGDYEAPIANLEGYIEGGDSAAIRLRAPPAGAYRLFVYVYDGHGHAAHANIPFLVQARDPP